MVNTQIISAFAGMGKSHFESENKYSCLDLDSSNFSKDPKFPHNYINEIIDNVGKYKYILISTHDVVINELARRMYDFIVLIPHKNQKDVFEQRYVDRISSIDFITHMMDNWDNYIDMIQNNDVIPTLIKTNKYLSDVIEPKQQIKVYR